MGIAMRVRVLGALATAGALALSGGPAIAAGSSTRTPMAYTCTGGEVPSGHYLRITVKGACQVPANAKIRVVGNVNVAAGGMFDAQNAPSTITVGGSVTGARGSFVGLGCQPDLPTQSGHACTVDPTGSSTITVKGSVTAFGASTVLLNGITVKGDVSLIGGGGPIPWSIKNSTIGRNLTVAGQTTDWLGVLFNSVRGNVTLLYIKVTDTDPGAPGAYVVRNTIGQNLICADVTPGISGGFIPGEVNVVGRHAYGQCKTLV